MNSLIIIGNLTADPVTHTTQSGVSFCSFTVAVNRRSKAQGQQEADFFRVTAFRELGDICARYLTKGRKVSVQGSVSVSTFTGKDGSTRASLDVLAQNVEFLNTRSDAAEADYTRQECEAIRYEVKQESAIRNNAGFIEVNEDLPF